MYDAARFQLVVLQIALHGVQLGDRIADRRAGSKKGAAAVVTLLNVATFHEQVEGLFGACQVAESGNTAQRSCDEEILELMRFIHKERIDTEIREADCLVLGACIGLALQSLRHALLGLLHPLDGDAVALLRFHLYDRIGQIVDLLLEQFAQRVIRHADLLERTVRDDDRIPVAGGNAAEQAFTVLFLEVALFCDQYVCAWIQRVKRILPLQQQVVGDHKHRLAHQPHALAFHDRADAYKRLACTDNVIEQGSAILDTSPYRILLVWAQRDVERGTWQGKVRSVVLRRDIGIEAIVVNSGQLFASVLVLPYPIKERLADLVRLLVGGRRLHVIDAINRVAVRVLASLDFHLDRAVGQNRLNQFVCRICLGAPCDTRHCPVALLDVDQPFTERFLIRDAPANISQQVSDKLVNNFARNPCRSELNGNINWLDVRWLHGTLRIDVLDVSWILNRGLFSSAQFRLDVSRQILVGSLPAVLFWIEID